VQDAPFDLAAETALLSAGRADVGAVASFVGQCRDEGGTLAALELEHYPAMAQAQLTRIAEDAALRWPLRALTVIHRFGRFEPGDAIVLVIATSSHRDAAFDAVRFVMDFLKTDAPFWKREHLRHGCTANWVDAKASDDHARDRWSATVLPD
jgi:molybdopterin synthase catalytic subunit